MSSIRVYLPATLPALALLHAEGELAVPLGYAATPDPDDEELAYTAYRLAAEASMRLLRADPGAPPRRVVISADVPAEPVGGGVVRLAAPVPLPAVAAIHLDDAAAGPDVAAAIAGEDDDVDRELAWYDASELPGLLGEVTARGPRQPGASSARAGRSRGVRRRTPRSAPG